MKRPTVQQSAIVAVLCMYALGVGAETPAPSEKIKNSKVETVGEIAPPPSTFDRQNARSDNSSAAPGVSDNSRNADERSLIEQTGRMLFGLAVVVGLIYLFGRFGLSRLTHLRGVPVVRGNRELKLVERLPLGVGQVIYLVELGDGRRVLIGGGDHGLRLLTETDFGNGLVSADDDNA